MIPFCRHWITCLSGSHLYKSLFFNKKRKKERKKQPPISSPIKVWHLIPQTKEFEFLYVLVSQL